MYNVYTTIHCIEQSTTTICVYSHTCSYTYSLSTILYVPFSRSPAFTPVACSQHGRPPEPLQCHGEGAVSQAGDHQRASLDGERDADTVLPEHSIQTSQDHLLQGRGQRRTVPTGTMMYSGKLDLLFDYKIWHQFHLDCTPNLVHVLSSHVAQYYCPGHP